MRTWAMHTVACLMRPARYCSLHFEMALHHMLSIMRSTVYLVLLHQPALAIKWSALRHVFRSINFRSISVTHTNKHYQYPLPITQYPFIH